MWRYGYGMRSGTRKAKPSLTLCGIVFLAVIHGARSSSAAQRCFCTVTGSLDDCACDVETIDSFNNKQLFPKLQKLLATDYFRFYKANLNKPCPFWTDNNYCGSRYCAVKPCTPNELPDGIKSGWQKQPPLASEDAAEECERAEKLGAVNSSLSQEMQKALEDWSRYDDEEERFCMVDDEESPDSEYVDLPLNPECFTGYKEMGQPWLRDEECPDSEYVDLLLNPERFTGYKGPEAWQIWNSIYEENCFKPYTVNRPLNPLAKYAGDNEGRGFYNWLDDLCVEKRAFYRLVSGLHSSINIHLSARYLLEDSWFGERWGHNASEFQQRFDERLTKGEGPKRLRNLYFLYLIELRALAKVLPFFQQSSVELYTGQTAQDQQNKQLLLELLTVAKSFPLHFDETLLFAGNKKEAAKLKEDFRMTFKNISRIMDCVGCFKCRLWGKLQTQGLGTALKILFSERQIESLPKAQGSQGSQPPFQLSRQEIVALFNAFGRISTSVRELENFRSLLSGVRDEM